MYVTIVKCLCCPRIHVGVVFVTCFSFKSGVTAMNLQIKCFRLNKNLVRINIDQVIEQIFDLLYIIICVKVFLLPVITF